jgi:hypothetical protein
MSTNNSSSSQTVSQTVHKLSDLIYDIKEKISDQEYMNLMNTITSFKGEKESEIWYTFTIIINSIDTRMQFCHDYEKYVDSFNFMDHKLVSKVVKVHSRLLPCRKRKNLKPEDYCYSCSNTENMRDTHEINDEYCSTYYSYRKYIEELNTNNKTIVYPNIDVSLINLALNLHDCTDVLKYISEGQPREINSIQVENRDRYSFGRKKRKRDSYDSKIKCSTLPLNHKCMIYSIEKM